VIEQEPTQRRPILIVEDEDDIRDFVAAVLTRAGYAVDVASNGVEALDRVALEPPRAILLDMRMPVMDGWEFARIYYAQSGTPAPVIVMTAAHDASMRASQVQAAGVLGKPFDLHELLSVVALTIGHTI
jgi:two-component system chemotaxis response regulator CheY